MKLDGNRESVCSQRRQALLGHRAVVLVMLTIGMSCYWQYFRHANIVGIFSDEQSTGFGLVGDRPVWPWLFYGSALLFGVAVLVMGKARQTGRIRGLSRLAVVTGLVASFASLACVCPSPLFHSSAAVRAIGIATPCLLGAAFSFATYEWGRQCFREVRRGFRTAVLCICASALLSFAVSSALFSLSPIPNVMRACMPAFTAALLAIVQHCQKRQERREDCRESPADCRELSESRCAACAAPYEPAAERRADGVSCGLVLLNVVLLVVVVCTKGVYDSVLTPSDGSDLWLKHAITVGELVAILSVTFLAVEFRKLAFLGWMVLSGGIVTGCAVLLLLDSHTAWQIGLGTLAAARTCLEVFVFILACTRRGTRSPCAIDALLLLLIPDAASCLFGYGVLPQVLAPFFGSSEGLLRGITVVLGILLVSCTFFVMSALSFRGLSVGRSGVPLAGLDGGPLPKELARKKEAAAPVAHESVLHAVSDLVASEQTEKASSISWVDQLAERYGLTPRECDIAAYVYRGYSAKRTAEIMCVSLSTVQSHTKNLYRKLAIHSRQDLIDLIDQGLV